MPPTPSHASRKRICGKSRSPIATSCTGIKNISQLAEEISTSESAGLTRFSNLTRVLDVRLGAATCFGTPELNQKFGMEEDNVQSVVCVTEILGNGQVWWNRARTRKPQTFKIAAEGLPDSTENGKNCDFCQWKTLTAGDTFGRVENESCVTASNLFKFAYPCHGLVLFKHHHPLEFSMQQILDLLDTSSQWFDLAATANPKAQHPLFLWNCLPRAGASQFHGHAQVTLTEVPVPEAKTLHEVNQAFTASHSHQSYNEALLEAHAEAGLARSLYLHDDRAHCFASLVPRKDAEIVIVGKALTSRSFGCLLHGCLRCLIDKLGVTSFNVGILNIPLNNHKTATGPIVARIVSRGSLSSRASDYGGLEVFGGASIGHTDPFDLIQALDSQFAGQEGYATYSLA